MQAAGIEIGNHTVSHLDEARYSRSHADLQVSGAQAAIRRHVGMLADSFAYPFGRMPANLVTSVMASGLKVAYSNVGGADETAATAYFWPRIRIPSKTTAAGILWLVNPYRRGSLGPPASTRVPLETGRRSGNDVGHLDPGSGSADANEPCQPGIVRAVAR